MLCDGESLLPVSSLPLTSSLLLLLLDLVAVKLFEEQLFLPQPRNSRLPENNQERRPITIELNLNAIGKAVSLLPVSSPPNLRPS